MKRFFILAAFLVISVPTMAAQSPSVLDLEHNCKDAQKMLAGNSTEIEGLNGSGCLSYLQAVGDMLTLMRALFPTATVACLPEAGVSVEQSWRLFLKYTSDHPDILDKRQAIGVVAALSNAFPCPAK